MFRDNYDLIQDRDFDPDDEEELDDLDNVDELEDLGELDDALEDEEEASSSTPPVKGLLDSDDLDEGWDIEDLDEEDEEKNVPARIKSAPPMPRAQGAGRRKRSVRAVVQPTSSPAQEHGRSPSSDAGRAQNRSHAKLAATGKHPSAKTKPGTRRK